MKKRGPKARDVLHVSEWNDRYPPGSPVTVRLDSGEMRPTRTRSAAWLLGGHTPVVMLDGIAGCYSLARVMPRPEGGAPCP